MARQQSLGEAHTRIVYLTIPVVIDGSDVKVDLTDDGEPGLHGNCFVHEGQFGYWTFMDAEDMTAAWDHLTERLNAD